LREQREVTLSTEDAERVERLYFEYRWRRDVLKQIQAAQLPVPPELLERHRREYVSCALELRQTYTDYLVKYAQICPKLCMCTGIDFREKKLYWKEVPHAEQN
jgi:hypothetical protein